VSVVPTHPEWVRSTTALWTDRADIQLYRAKSEGRNRVFIDQQREIAVSAEEKSMLFGPLSMEDPAWIEGIASRRVKHCSRQRNE
jgi:two-component system cell cycle response regulator